jgi:Reverse transcriptase (RNA-dependent DNA polymerase)
MEEARAPKSDNVVFSYRNQIDKETGDLFDRNYGWFQFMEQSLKVSAEFEFVVACDISEFYPRLGHHRLENALKQIAGDTPYPKRIMRFLSNYSNTRSFGLPIGGPAARILSEITINQIDRLLIGNGIKFTRFADDYHLFAGSREDAYRYLIFLSEKLFDNQGLSLQKSKTRIMTSAEFKATNPLKHQMERDEAEIDLRSPERGSSELLRFSLRFDPYSATAKEDYERLSSEIKKFDIIKLLKDELAKSRVHTALARKIVAAIRYLDGTTKDDAVLSIIENCDVLYPIFSSVLLMLAQVFDELSASTKNIVTAEIQKLIKSHSHVFRVDVHLSYAIRVLAHSNVPDNLALLQQIYEERTSPLVRRDIILVLAKWGEWYWLSDRRNRFRELSGPERRAFIVASYILKDEGDHWRDHIVKELNPFEKFIMRWAGQKANLLNWVVPI